MDLRRIVESIDAETARAFVAAARHVIDAMLVEGERLREMQTPAACDYERAGLRRDTPAGGWVSHDELRETARRLGEAVAAEKWTEGLVEAVRMLSAVGGLL